MFTLFHHHVSYSPINTYKLKQTVRETRTIPGGGCAEINMARAIGAYVCMRVHIFIDMDMDGCIYIYICIRV